jgi:hypothetical protein
MRQLVVALLSCAIGVAVLAPAAFGQARRTVADPAGGPSWTADVRSGDGRREQCVVLRRGRLAKGRYCASFAGSAVYEYTTRRETGAQIDPRRWRTVYVVNLSRSVVRATLTTLDGVVTYRRGRGPRVLLAVLRGDAPQARLDAVVERGSRTRRISAGPPATVTVPDPLGENPWRLVRDTDGRQSACVRWERVRRFTPATVDLPRGRERCGDPGDAIAVAAADRVDGRLVVTGVAGEDVRSVVLRSQAGSRPTELDDETGGFLAVLSGDVDPASLTVVATLRGGRRVTRALTSTR